MNKLFNIAASVVVLFVSLATAMAEEPKVVPAPRQPAVRPADAVVDPAVESARSELPGILEKIVVAQEKLNVLLGYEARLKAADDRIETAIEEDLLFTPSTPTDKTSVEKAQDELTAAAKMYAGAPVGTFEHESAKTVLSEAEEKAKDIVEKAKSVYERIQRDYARRLIPPMAVTVEKILGELRSTAIAEKEKLQAEMSKLKISNLPKALKEAQNSLKRLQQERDRLIQTISTDKTAAAIQELKMDLTAEIREMKTQLLSALSKVEGMTDRVAKLETDFATIPLPDALATERHEFFVQLHVMLKNKELTPAQAASAISEAQQEIAKATATANSALEVANGAKATADQALAAANVQMYIDGCQNGQMVKIPVKKS